MAMYHVAYSFLLSWEPIQFIRHARINQIERTGGGGGGGVSLSLSLSLSVYFYEIDGKAE